MIVAGILALHYGLTQYLWIMRGWLGATLALWGVSLALLIFFLRKSPDMEPAAPDTIAPKAPLATGWVPTLFQPVLALILVACAATGLEFARTENWALLGSVILAVALLVRLVPGPEMPQGRGWVWSLLVLALFAVAGAFRFYKIGEIPLGLTGTDEMTIWEHVQLLVNGQRFTYDTTTLNLGADGTVPMYLMAAGLIAFGDSMAGWRMESAIMGFLIVGLVYKVGKDLGGRWVGIIAGFLWAVSVWPVSITRSHYYMGETLLVVMLCLAFLLAALRRGGAWRFVLAGFFWAQCFNAYPAARVMGGLVPWAFALAWLMVPQNRKQVWAGVLPLGAGFLVGMAPLLLWMRSDPNAMNAYFIAFGGLSHQGGNLGDGSLLSRIDASFTRLLAHFPANFSLLTSRGPINPGFFPIQYPIVHASLLATAILGLGVALGRFREPLYAFTVYAWFAGMVPALISAPGTVPYDRRSLMTLVPTLLFAALGVTEVARRLWLLFKHQLVMRAVFLAALAAGLGWYAQASWHDYSVRNMGDPDLVSRNWTNNLSVWRKVRELRGGREGVVISTWRRDNNSWRCLLVEPRAGLLNGKINPKTHVIWSQQNQPYFEAGGFGPALLEAARVSSALSAPDGVRQDVFVVLMPFFYYLEPALQGLSGKLEAVVPLAMTTQGPLVGEELAAHPTEFARIYRVPVGAITPQMALPGPFKVEVTELTPPRLTREQARTYDVRSPEFRQELGRYKAQPGAWRPGRKKEMLLTDPWFWATDGELPGYMQAPLSVRVRAQLKVETPGEHRFGASATVWTRIKVDGRTVFERDPQDPALELTAADLPPGALPGLENEYRERRGVLGDPVTLAAGTHQIEIEQVMISTNGNCTLLLRPLWQAPGGQAMTLPLENLIPLR